MRDGIKIRLGLRLRGEPKKVERNYGRGPGFEL
jgi:hypothetical protein